MKQPNVRGAPALAAIFFLSGVAGLAYQVLWAKALGAGIGHEYPATLAVVTAQMSGMGLGAWAYYLGRSRLAYSTLELLIGLWGGLSVLLIPVLNHSVIRWLGVDPSFAWHWSVVFAAVFLALLPASSAMGATLPALQQAFSAAPAAGTIGRLYAANTAGAVIGTLVTAFSLMPLLGIRNATLAAAGLNIVCAAAARWLGDRALPDAKPNSTAPLPSGLAARLFLAGLLGIGFETVLIRALSHFLENTVYTFAVVLAVYLFGAALGAALYRRRALSAATLFGALALSCILTSITLRWLPQCYLALRNVFGDSLTGVAISEASIGVIAFLLPSLAMGALFTLLASRALESGRPLGWSVAVNAFGSAVGPILFGVIFIPWFGLRTSLVVLIAGYAALSARVWPVVCAVLALPLVTASTDLIARVDQKIVYHREGLMASVSVLESTNGSRVLKVNNRFQMGGTAARVAEARHADIPLLLHPHPQRALFIGLGTGISFSAAANFPGLHADGVELLPEVVNAMPFFREKEQASADPNLRVYVADGRRFVQTTTNIYDVVVGDLFHPAQDGAAFLYTREHFAAVRARLAKDGLFCQWLPLFQMDLRTLDVITVTFQSVFANTELWLLRFNVDTPVVGLIGRNGEQQLAPGAVEARTAQSERLRGHLRAVALGDSLRLEGCRLGRPAAYGSVRVNTDDRPVILFQAPSMTFQRRDDPGERLLSLLERFPIPDGRLGEYMKARNTYLAGLQAESKGDIVSALRHYVQSARLSHEFTSGYAQALGIATTLARSNPSQAQAILTELIEAQPDRPVARQLLERLR